MRVKASHPFTYNGVLRAPGTVVEVDDDFGRRVLSAGLAHLATGQPIPAARLDSGLELAVRRRMRNVAIATRLATVDPRLSIASADVTSVNANVPGDAVNYDRAYTYQSAGVPLEAVADFGEGNHFWLPQGVYAHYSYGPFNAMPRSVRVMCDGARFCWYQISPTGFGQAAVYIDGRPANGAQPMTIGEGATYNTIVFPSARVRQIEIRTLAGIGGMFTHKPYSLWKPPARQGPRVLVIGDSWTSSASVVNHLNATYWNIGPHLGSDDVWVDHYGGTGYTVGTGADGSGANRYIDRVENSALGGITWDLEAIDPDMVVVHGGGANDCYKGRTNQQIIDGVVAVFTRLRQRLPLAKLVFVEGFGPPLFAQFNPRYVQIREAVQQQLRGVGVYYIDVATTRPWVTGQGTATAPANDGTNADKFISTDGAHVTDEGGRYVRNRLGAPLRTVLLDDGARLNTLISHAA